MIMNALTGNDIITILRAASADNKNDVLAAAKDLSIDDYNQNDIIVQAFLSSFPNGFKSSMVNGENLNKIAESLDKLKSFICSVGVRKAFNLLTNVNHKDDLAVQFENKCEEMPSISGAEAQIKAAQLISFLSKYSSNKNDKKLLQEAENYVHQGNLREASSNLYKVYSGEKGPRNIRTAFVTLNNQPGEPYQMCPKGIYIWGQPRPMAVSSCAENCIDARLHPDGTVGCNYGNWLNENLITQKQALNLFDNIKQEQETMNLKEGERTKFPMSDQDSQDMRMRRLDNTPKEPWESQLENLNSKKIQKPKDVNRPPVSVFTDSTIEKILSESRDVFDDNDLDTLEQMMYDEKNETKFV